MKKIEGIIDRFEGEKAVIRANGKEFVLPKSFLEGAKEGDVINFGFETNASKTQKLKTKSTKLISEILGKRKK